MAVRAPALRGWLSKAFCWPRLSSFPACNVVENIEAIPANEAPLARCGGNILLDSLVGWVVDFATGSVRKLSQDSLQGTLAPLPAVQAPTSRELFALFTV